MSNTVLTFSEAKKSWVLRATGWKVRDIGSRFKVDPRRLYEVWSEERHIGSRAEAQKLFMRLLPGENIEGRFKLHIPKLQVRLKPTTQPRLPGF